MRKHVYLAMACLFYLSVLPPLGAEPFKYHASDITVDNTATIIDLIVNGNPWVDVRAFGAKGDASTNNSSAIQSAVDAAGPWGIVSFPVPSDNTRFYAVQSTINVPAGQRWIGGAGGYDGPVLYWTGSDNGVMVRATGPYASFEGIEFNGNSKATGVLAKANTTYGYMQSLTFTRCRFNFCKDGFRAEASDSAVSQNEMHAFYSCMFSNNQRGAVAATLQTDFWAFYSCVFASNSVSGYASTGTNGSVKFSSCIFPLTTIGVDLAQWGGQITLIMEHCQGESGTTFIKARNGFRIILIGSIINEPIDIDGGYITSINSVWNV